METTAKFVDMICPICGKAYQAKVARLKWSRQSSCSRACSYKFRVQETIKSRTDITCAVCGKEFYRTPTQLSKAKHGNNFCSSDCHYKARSLGLTKRIVTEPYQYTPEGKAAQIASASKPKGKRVVHWLECVKCGKIYDDPTDSASRRNKKANFCSLDCCNAYRVGENNPSWRGGHDKYYGQDWKAVRRMARIRDNHTCQRCGKNKKQVGRNLDVHHIKPVSTFTNRNDANTMDNVVTLCHACHMHVEWHGIDFQPSNGVIVHAYQEKLI